MCKGAKFLINLHNNSHKICMYDYIKGSISSLSHTAVVVETFGVGYLINISLTTYSMLEGCQEALVYTHLYTVQDSAPILYGFFSTAERDLFRLLISVSGIGAGTARIMLSSNSPIEIASMISTGNVAMLTKVKGIGPKTAEMVVIKLRDKVTGLLSSQYTSEDTVIDGAKNIDSWNEALDALLVLGFSKTTTEKIVRKIARENPAFDTGDIIRQALSEL